MLRRLSPAPSSFARFNLSTAPSFPRLLFCALAVFFLFTAARPFAFAALVEGEIAGAKFAIARPALWNRQLLLIAHGYRDEKAPLIADLFPDQLATKTLVDRGWMVAKTSYRRNGMVIADAIADLDALRAHIVHSYGTPTRVILEGESMGGLIVTLMAEREPGLYAGAIAIGAALSAKESDMTLGLSLQPQIPLLFLTNQSELEGPKNYVSAKLERPAANLRPALFRVSRSGHVNVNQRERLAAIEALIAWLDRDRDALPRPAQGGPYLDATITPAPQPSRVARDPDARGFTARITEISAIYGNVFLDAQPADFTAVGIGGKTFFQLTVHGETHRVLYGRDFNDVKRGEWVAFPNADGYVWLSRNYENAATSARLQLGDTLILRRYPDPK